MSASLFRWRSLTILAMLATGAAASGQAVQPGDAYAPSAYPETYNGDSFFPATEIRALPAAHAQAIAARAQLRMAESDLNNAVADVRREFNRSMELHEALSDEKEAYEAVVAAR